MAYHITYSTSRNYSDEIRISNEHTDKEGVIEYARQLVLKGCINVRVWEEIEISIEVITSKKEDNG